MTSGFTQTFLVTPARQAVGLTSVALGIVLMSIILGLNVVAHRLRCWAARRYG